MLAPIETATTASGIVAISSPRRLAIRAFRLITKVNTQLNAPQLLSLGLRQPMPGA
jgi:hypothetical protein